MLELSRSIRSSMAFAECRLSRVVDNMDKFLINFNIVIWWFGVIRRRSFRTPEEVSTVYIKPPRELTFENHTVRHDFLHIILGLRKQIENVDNTTGYKL